MLAPVLTQPTVAFGLFFAVIAVALAWRSVALPLALASFPTLLTALYGTNPLPKGGATFLVALWILLGVAMVFMRREQEVAVRGLMTLPVAMAVLIAGLMLLRLNTSMDQHYGSMKVQLYIADNLVFLVGAIFVGVREQNLRLFLSVTLVITAIGAVALLGGLVTGSATQQYGGRYTISAQEGAINLGRSSSNGALIAICLIMASTKRWLRITAMCSLPLLLVSLIAAGSRGPTVAFVVGLVALIGLTTTVGRSRRRLVLVGAVVIVGAILIPVVVPGSSIGRSLSTIIGSSSGLSSNGRSALWAKAFTAFGAHSLVGIGTGGFAALDPESYPHNILLEMAAELGIIGAVAFIAMAASIVRRLIVLWRRTHGRLQLEVTLLIALFLSALVNAIFSGAVQDNSDLWLWGGLGVGVYVRQRYAQGAPEPAVGTGRERRKRLVPRAAAMPLRRVAP